MIRITRAQKDSDYERAVPLFQEYAASLDFDLEFQGFGEELANLRQQYSPPTGCLLLAERSNRSVGCVALRKIEDKICEMKRLYVVPDFRGKGIGQMLVEAIIEEASAIGYDCMRLDTVSTMVAAKALYALFGFREIEPYRYNPIEKATFMELKL